MRRNWLAANNAIVYRSKASLDMLQGKLKFLFAHHSWTIRSYGRRPPRSSHVPVGPKVLLARRRGCAPNIFITVTERDVTASIRVLLDLQVVFNILLSVGTSTIHTSST